MAGKMKRRRLTAEEWREVLGRQGESGLGPTAFCRQEGLVLTTFHKWKARLASGEQEAGFVELEAKRGRRASLGHGAGAAARGRAADAGLRMLWESQVRRILAWSEPVDMRKSFDGLVAIVQGVLKEDPLSGTLFVFFNRRGNYLKLVYWDRTGYCLFAKRLEQGRFRLPGAKRKQDLDTRAFLLLLDGISLGMRRRIG